MLLKALLTRFLAHGATFDTLGLANSLWLPRMGFERLPGLL